MRGREGEREMNFHLEQPALRQVCGCNHPPHMFTQVDAEVVCGRRWQVCFISLEGCSRSFSMKMSSYSSVCVCVCVCVCIKLLSVWLFATLWTVAHQATPSMGCTRQEYWSGLPFLSPGYLPNPGIKPMSLMSPALAGGFFTPSTTWEAPETH